MISLYVQGHRVLRLMVNKRMRLIDDCLVQGQVLVRRYSQYPIVLLVKEEVLNVSFCAKCTIIPH